MAKYQSSYTDKKVSAAQYIAEIMCSRRAKSLGEELPSQFWNAPHWKSYFLYQIRACPEAIKIYGERALIKAIKDSRSSTIFSIKHKTIAKLAQFYKKTEITHHKEKWWMSSNKMTVFASINTNNIITDTSPISSKFIGQHIKNLADWLRSQGGFKYNKMDETTKTKRVYNSVSKFGTKKNILDELDD